MDDDAVIAETLAWQARLKADDVEWNAFADWLEADPRHRRTFDEFALVDRVVDDHRHRLPASGPVSSNVVDTRKPRAWRAFGAAAVLAVTATSSTWLLWPARPDTVYVTARGKAGRFQLADGVSAELAPATKLVVRSGNVRDLELAAGEAYFDVAHDPSRTLLIRIGGISVSDIGTKFSVSRSGGDVVVAVSEGQVSITGDANARLGAGQRLTTRSDEGTARISRVSQSDVGSWRRGRLVYDQAPLRMVIADVSRYSNQDVILDKKLENRVFSGVLAADDGDRMVRTVAAVMDIPVQMEGGRLHLGGSGGR